MNGNGIENPPAGYLKEKMDARLHGLDGVLNLFLSDNKRYCLPVLDINNLF